jgi:hypothetical protein
MAEEKEGSGFKVVDRRGLRSEEPASRPTPPGSTPPRREESAAAGLGPGFEERDLGPVGFEMILSYLSTTALFQLGMLPGPGGERIPPDLVNGRRTIDMLEVLQQKTRGNLTADESSMLENVLYELRMSYVEIQKLLAQPPK